ncbi:MAG TPA: polysaccharide biosynthesis/export family protein [bacterium]|nr:polysaccharide biosynthesis/export family protein [bacterium]
MHLDRSAIVYLLIPLSLLLAPAGPAQDRLEAEEAALALSAEASEAPPEAVVEVQVEEEISVPVRPELRIRYFYGLGLDAFEARDYRQAVNAFEEVVLIDPGYRRADYYRREAWELLAAEEAGDSGTEEIILDDLRAEFDRGVEAMRGADYPAAVEAFQNVVRVDPSNREARRLLGEARLQLEKKDMEEEEALAAQLAQEEAELRQMAGEEEDRALREAYAQGFEYFQRGDLDRAEEKFVEVNRQRRDYRRTGIFLRRLDHEIQRRTEEDYRLAEKDVVQQYTLGPDDAVKVVVRNHPEFSFSAKVEEGGELIIPLTNEIIMADGLTRDELAEELRRRLTSYIDNPFVKVFITLYGSKKFYVLQPQGGGAEYIMDKANMTLWDCMFRAGIPQLNQSAMRRIQVITPHRTHPTHRWINVYAMLYEGKMQDNIRIEPGTIIYYPMLVIDKFSQIVLKITQPISDLASLGDAYEDWDQFRKDYLR